MAKSVLGMAFGPGLIQVAEVAVDAKTVKAARAADFIFSEGDTLDKPLELGKKFSAFLKENKFSAKHVVAGLPTQWLMLKTKTVPTMTAGNLAGMLRLQAERDFSIEPNDLVIDYVFGEMDRASAAAARPLLLAAAMRTRVEQIRALLKAANLAPLALTSSALSLAVGTFAGSVISVGCFGAELILKAGGNLSVPTVLASSIATDGAWLVPSIGEARRALAMLAHDPAAPIGLWNDAGMTAAQISELQKGLDASIKPLTLVTGVDMSGVPNPLHAGCALALAHFKKSAELDTLDFFDSKLVEKTEGMFAKFKTWMALAALLAIVLVGWLAVSWYQDSSELNTLNQQSEARKAETKTAKAFVSRFASTQGWYDKRLNVLDSLNALKDVIPPDGSAWMTRLSVKEDFRCEMSAKAVNDKRYFEVLDQIEKNEAFRDVKLVYMNKQDKKNTDVSFAISFIFWKQ